MFVERPKYNMFSDLPQGVHSFLLSPGFDSGIQKIAQDYILNEDQRKKISKLVLAAAFNDIPLSEAIGQLKAVLVSNSIPETKWPTFVADLLRTTVWPLREFFGDELTNILDQYQITPSGWPDARIPIKPLSYSGVVSEVGNRVGMTLLSQQTRERLRELLVSKLKDVRTDDQLLEMLQRQVDIGGLGIDTKLAERVVAEFNELIDSVEIVSEDEYADWLVASRKPKVEPVVESEKPLTEDESEIAAISARMPQPTNSPQSVLDQAVETTFASLATRPVDDYSAKRLRYIISSRLRDVRNPIELSQLLMRDTKVGGMGYDQATADAMMKQIESQYVTFHSVIMQDEKSKLDQQLQEQSAKIDARKKREAEEHAQWYKEKIESRKRVEDEGKQIADRMKKAFAVVHPMDAKEQATEEKRFGKMVPTESIATVVPQEVKVSQATIDLQVASIPTKPRLDDVKYSGPRLTGPIQELKEMSLVEFRRLSKDPEMAVQKIMQRLAILQQEAFERRIEAIRAWRSCPLQKMYVELMSEAFQKAKPVAQLAEEKQSAGQECPTPAEIAAIISLNSKLHF